MGLSRRRMLQLGGSGLAAVAAGACAQKPVASSNPTAATVAALPLAPPPAPPPPAPTVASRTVLCRDAWGARAARPGGIPHVPVRMTIHHTAVVLGDNSNAPGRLRQHQRYHQDTHGWIDIAYHFSVDRNGNIYALRSPDLVGDTATSYDPTGHFLVVCEGDFDQEAITEAQLDGAAFVFAWAAQQYGIATDTIRGHKDASSDTACPGSGLYAHVTSGALKSRVDAVLASGTVDLVSLCGEAGSAAVAGIESGAG